VVRPLSGITRSAFREMAFVVFVALQLPAETSAHGIRIAKPVGVMAVEAAQAYASTKSVTARKLPALTASSFIHSQLGATTISARLVMAAVVFVVRRLQMEALARPRTIVLRTSAACPRLVLPSDVEVSASSRKRTANNFQR